MTQAPVSTVHTSEEPQILDIQSNYPKRKRNQKWSFRQAIEDILQRNQDLPKSYNPSDTRYTIFEDLKLIIEMCQHKKLNIEIFEGFAERGLLKKKSARSMMQRYIKVLYHVRKEEMKKILEHCRHLGLFGRIVRDNEEIEISLEENQSGEEGEEEREDGDGDSLVEIEKVGEVDKGEMGEGVGEQEDVRVEEEGQMEDKNQDVQVPLEEPEPESDSLLEIQRVQPQLDSIKLLGDPSSFPEDSQNRLVLQLRQTIDYYSSLHNLDPVSLLHTLHKLSGDLVVLDWYIQIKDQKLKWTESEDRAITDDDEELIAYLIQKRGREHVYSRKRYLNS